MVEIHLVDGTYELFRMFFGAPKSETEDGVEVGAVKGVARTLLQMLRGSTRQPAATHVGIAFDTVIESFRNDLFDGYKTGEGIAPVLKEQFPLVERMADALGVVVWRMVDFEADDAIAAAAHKFSGEVDRVHLCSPDKDLAQCVVGDHVVLVDRMRRKTYDADAVHKKYGVPPRLIPDFLGLVGDDADGIPGIPRWGQKSAASALCHFGDLESIPLDPNAWDLEIRGKAKLCESLSGLQKEASLYKRLATLRTDVPLETTMADLEWKGADRAALTAICGEIDDIGLLKRVPKWRTPLVDR